MTNEPCDKALERVSEELHIISNANGFDPIEVSDRNAAMASLTDILDLTMSIILDVAPSMIEDDTTGTLELVLELLYNRFMRDSVFRKTTKRVLLEWMSDRGACPVYESISNDKVLIELDDGDACGI